MPWSPKGPCSTSGCPHRAERAGKCTQHYAAIQRSQDERRGTRQERGYTAQWYRIVARKKREQPWCSVCLCLDTPENPLTGDHILPLERGGESTYENCDIKCRRHNSSKGARAA
jgi:5-methylcytosine-specific restriction enzyme A